MWPTWGFDIWDGIAFTMAIINLEQRWEFESYGVSIMSVLQKIEYVILSTHGIFVGNIEAYCIGTKIYCPVILTDYH